MATKLSKAIFISHAAADKDIADKVADLLSSAMGIDADKQVFCTSLEGMRIPPGKDFKEFIKDQIQSPKLVLILISPNYLASQFCIAEAGASWAMSHRVIPILIPPAKFDDMKAVLAGLHAVKVDDASDWNDVLHVLKEALKVNPTTNRWELKRDKILREIRRVLRKRSKDGTAPTMHDYLQGSGSSVDRDKRSRVSQAFAESTLRRLDIFAGDLSWLAEDLAVYKVLRKRGVQIRILTDTPSASAIPLGRKIGIIFRAYSGSAKAPLKASVSDADEETESRAFVVKRHTPRTTGKTGYDYWVKVYHGSEEFVPIKALATLFEMLFASGKRL